MQSLRAAIFNFAFVSERRKFGGINIRNWIQLGLMFLTGLWLWLQLWPTAAATAAGILILNFIYGRAQKARYTTFSPIPQDGLPAAEPLEPDQKIPVRGTGTFYSGETESNLLMAAGELWLQPVGTVAIMLEAAPEIFKYQFVEPDRIESLRLGNVSFGGTTQPAIDVTFMSNWAHTDELFSNDTQSLEESKYKKRSLMLMFDDLESATRVHQTLV